MTVAASRSRRMASLLLVCLLAPALVLAGPARPAAAATTVGPAVDYSMDWNTSAVPEGFWMDCTMRAQWTFDGFMQGVRTSGKCSLGFASGSHEWDIRAWYRGYQVVNGQRTSQQCSMRNVPTDETTLTEAWSLTATQGNLAGYEDELITRNDPVVDRCDVDEVCFEAREDVRFYGDNVFEECQAVAVGYPAASVSAEVTTCNMGDVARPVFNSRNVYSPNTLNKYWREHWDFTIQRAVAGARWHFYLVVQGPNTGYALTTRYTSPNQALQTVDIGDTWGGENATGVYKRDAYVGVSGHGATNQQPPAPNALVVGAGVYYDDGSSITQDARRGTPQTKPGTGKFGVTNVSECAWYWGPKIAITTSDDTDEPAGPLGGPLPPVQPGDPDTGLPANEPEPQEDEGCGFSIGDPSTWATAGICALVGIMKLVLGTLGEILKAIRNIGTGILNGIGALFIPSQQAVEDALGTIRDSFADTYPGKWVAAVTDVNLPAAASGCSGPYVNVNLGHGIKMDAHPLEACSGAPQTLATLSRTGLTLWVGYFGGMACVRAIGSGFGWTPGGGRE